MDYRNEANLVKKDATWTFWKFLPLFLVIIAVLFVVGFGLRSIGLLGGTVVERKVFEQSFQRSEALKSEIAMNEAVLMEINRKLLNSNLDADIRFNLEAQASSARIRIETARRKQ